MPAALITGILEFFSTKEAGQKDKRHEQWVSLDECHWHTSRRTASGSSSLTEAWLAASGFLLNPPRPPACSERVGRARSRHAGSSAWPTRGFPRVVVECLLALAELASGGVAGLKE